MKKGVRSWLGWTRWNVVIAQTPLFIGVSYMQFSDDFTQLSENLGFKMDFEDILGIVAISTFLVGFSSVRLQSILEERKDSEARKIDRVLEQNAGKDLLPLPTSLGQMAITQDNFSKDKTTFFTILLTWLNFIIASLLIGVHQVNSDFSPIPFWLVQIIHLFIVLIGSFGPKFVQKQFLEYQKKQPFECYKQMMVEIRKYLKSPENIESLKQTIINFDASVPEWSWLTLIRCSVFPEEKNNPQLKRIYDLVKPQKNADAYSLVAFVWSAYLLDNGEDDSISRLVEYSDIEKILDFGSTNTTKDEKSQSGDSSQSFDNKTPIQRCAAIKEFISSFNVLCDKNRNLGDPTNQGQMPAQTFALLTAREIYKVWSQTISNLN